jgi:hypothetical protein
MSSMLNNSTRKYPRTLEEAFGPYQRYGLSTKDKQQSKVPVVLSGAVMIGVFIASLIY